MLGGKGFCPVNQGPTVCACNHYFRVYLFSPLIIILAGPLIVILLNYSYVLIYIARLPTRHHSKRRNHLSIVIPIVIMPVSSVFADPSGVLIPN